MSETPEPSFSTDGPVFPCCDARWTTDEAHYFDESGFELTCEECSTVLSVQPHASWSWTSRAIKPWGEDPTEISDEIPPPPPAPDPVVPAQLHGTLVAGPTELLGKTALLRQYSDSSDLCYAQFDDLSLHKFYTHTWCMFLKSNFTLDDGLEWPA